MEADHNGPTSEGIDKIDRWRNAVKCVDQEKRHLSMAECELRNAINDLGKWMVPEDAKVGEKFCVWWGDSLISVKCAPFENFEITLRKRGKSMLK